MKNRNELNLLTITGAFIVIIIGFLELSSAQLYKKNYCGASNRVVCNQYQYCQKATGDCEPCEHICNPNHHNYDPKCVDECQDYIHDKLYVRKDEGMDTSVNLKELKDEVKLLKVLVIVSLTMTALLFLLILAHWCKRRNFIIARCFRNLIKKSEKPSNNNKSDVIPKTQSEKGKNNGELRLEMPSSPSSDVETTVAHSPATACTTLSRRNGPSEDRALDYAYDNPAMAVTPSPPHTGTGTRPHESSL